MRANSAHPCCVPTPAQEGKEDGRTWISSGSSSHPERQPEGPHWPWAWAGAHRMGTAPGTIPTKWPFCHYNEPWWHFPTAGASLLAAARWDREGTPCAPKSRITQCNNGEIRMGWSQLTLAKPGPAPPGSMGGSSFHTRPQYQEPLAEPGPSTVLTCPGSLQGLR